MNTFKKKSLYLAVAGVSALGAGSASAVTLNADGLGQVDGRLVREHGPQAFERPKRDPC